MEFSNINRRLDVAPKERAAPKANIDKVDGRIDNLILTNIGAAVVLSAAVISAAEAIIASQ
ncbi:MAG: hypothetical protein F4Y44_07565 [Chloroflexi bacterium]|nr:hypothetical protein [Chloroflexota bacterium]